MDKQKEKNLFFSKQDLVNLSFFNIIFQQELTKLSIQDFIQFENMTSIVWIS